MTTTATPTDKRNTVTSVKLGSRKQKLSALARLQKRSVHSLMLEAMDEYIAKTQARIEFEQSAIRSYEHFQETGLHVTIDELQQWAKSLNTSNHLLLPQCHK